MVTEVTKDFVIKFIETYRSHPALWNLNSEVYKNKQLRAHGFNQLLEKCRETFPKADREFVRKKINNLRTTYRREWLKVRASKLTSVSQDDVYVPSLWYYDLLTFINDDDDGKESVENFCYQVDDSDMHIKEEDVELHIASPEPSVSNDTDYFTTSFAKKVKFNNGFASRQQSHTKRPSEPLDGEEEFTIIGKRIALQLKAMDEHQRLLAERIVGDVMYWGRVGKLTQNCFKYENKE